MNTDPTPHHDISLPKPADAENIPHDMTTTPPTPVKPAPSQVDAHQAGDVDTIEKGWVTQVEQLFNAYGDDPYVLSQQLSELKREYIAKRYGRTLKKAGE